ncbi:MAG: tetratricopeptide repeat protein [Sediminibacterium sp.]|nr:tetratricopeptide repeat protein [Sediminibacterium sp.]
MKKNVALMFAALFAVQVLMAQMADGIKLLNYDKHTSAKEVFRKLYEANPKDPQNIYWMGQAYLAGNGVEVTKEDIAAAKAIYQKGLQEIGSDPMLLVGMGHVEIREGGDLNSAKQKFEQAITATTETRGRNKGKPSAAVLTAIGRANADGPSTMGDPVYAIDKLKQAATIDLVNPDIYIYMGINYQKTGGENGGDAVKSYQEAISRDPKNAQAMFRIGRIYMSQNNKELFEQFFENAIAADPAFPPVYYALYDYYENRDVTKAKDYLDKYVATADKDPRNELYLANYLFRAGRYDESLAKAKEIDASIGLKTLPKLGVVYAYNYDRLGDSLQAQKYINEFLATAPDAEKRAADYQLGAHIATKFPGNEAQASGYIEKALELDTVKANRIALINTAADMFGKAKAYTEQLKWMKRQMEIKGTMGEADHYKLTNAAYAAKAYPQTLEFAKAYMVAFPDKPQPYMFFKRAAMAVSSDSAVIVENLNYLDSVYAAVDKEKYKQDIFRNAYFKLVYYVTKFNNLKKSPDFKVKSDGTRTDVVDEFLATCQQALEVTDKMLELYPDAADENNKFATEQKAAIQKNIDYYSKSPGKQQPK